MNTRIAVKAAAAAVCTAAAGIVAHQAFLLLDFARAFVPFAPHKLQPAFSCDPSNAVKRSIVPKIIHQTWRTRDVSTYPKRASRDSWIKAYAELGWQVLLWDDSALDALVRTRYAWLHAFYAHTLRSGVQRADVGRLVVLHEYGGVYADLDASPASVLFGEACGGEMLAHDTTLVRSCDGHVLTNHVMAAVPRAPFLAYALHRLRAQSQALALPYLRVFYTTGPVFLTIALREYVATLSAGLVKDGAAWDGRSLSGDFRPSLARALDILVVPHEAMWSVVHHDAGRSWVSLDGRVLNWIADHGLVPHAIVAAMALFVLITTFATLFVQRFRRSIYTPINGKHIA